MLMARGLVVYNDGIILARPLPKFFNDFEISGSLPPGPIEVYEKMYGSLIVMFFFNGEPIFSTKGTFPSGQAAGLGNTRRLYCNSNSRGSELQGIGQILSPLEFYCKVRTKLQ